MTMPSVERTYGISPNNRTSASGTVLTDNRTTLLTIVNVFLAWGSNPMTVGTSSNGTTSGAANHWTTIADLIWHASGSPFSWIRLLDPAGFEILIALDATSADGHLISLYLSEGGFSGGSTTTRPTAADEVALVSQGAWGGVTVSTADSVIHLTHETSGSGGLTAVFMSAGAPLGFWHLSKVKDPLGSVGAYAGWSPAFWGVVQSGGTSMSLASLNGAAAAKAMISGGVGIADLFLTCEGYGGTALASAPYNDDQTHEYTLSPIGLFCAGSGNRGRKGSVYDLWFGQTVNQDGDSYPGDGSRQLIQFGDLVFPWNTTAPEIV